MTTLVAGRTQAELGRRLENGVAEIGLSLGRDERNKLLQYLALLEKWNQVYNLTAIRDREKMISGHLLDCLAVIPYVTGARVLDAGSGAGFPGIPVAVARPDIQVVLLDSNHKKAAFLRQAVADLQLKNATVVCERVETWQAARLPKLPSSSRRQTICLQRAACSRR
jgi:16S rRNA (guanine527-N7)-methyltransferase